jgi:hypothetical protein
VDYLQGRSDVTREAIAYQGINYGAIWAPIFLALEPRIKTGISDPIFVRFPHSSQRDVRARRQAGMITQPCARVSRRSVAGEGQAMEMRQVTAAFPYRTSGTRPRRLGLEGPSSGRGACLRGASLLRR